MFAEVENHCIKKTFSGSRRDGQSVKRVVWSQEVERVCRGAACGFEIFRFRVCIHAQNITFPHRPEQHARVTVQVPI